MTRRGRPKTELAQFFEEWFKRQYLRRRMVSPRELHRLREDLETQMVVCTACNKQRDPVNCVTRLETIERNLLRVQQQMAFLMRQMNYTR